MSGFSKRADLQLYVNRAKILSLIKISGSDERSDTAVLYLDLLRCQMREMCIEGLGGCPTWNVSLKFSFLFSVGFASIFSPLTEVLFSLSLILLPRLCFPCFLSSQASCLICPIPCPVPPPSFPGLASCSAPASLHLTI